MSTAAMEAMEALKLTRAKLEKALAGNPQMLQDTLEVFDCTYNILMKDAIADKKPSNYMRRFCFDLMVCFSSPAGMMTLFDSVNFMADLMTAKVLGGGQLTAADVLVDRLADLMRRSEEEKKGQGHGTH